MGRMSGMLPNHKSRISASSHPACPVLGRGVALGGTAADSDGSDGAPPPPPDGAGVAVGGTRVEIGGVGVGVNPA
jgi:hypothetical protein